MLAIPVDSIVGGVMTGVRAEEKKNMRRPTTVFFLVSVIKYFLWGGRGAWGVLLVAFVCSLVRPQGSDVIDDMHTVTLIILH